MARLACLRVREANLDPKPLLHSAGLTLEQIEDPHARFHVRSQVEFLNVAADALQDPLLGFHVARDFDLRETGLIYYVLCSSDTLGDALRRAERYGAIVNEGIALKCLDFKNTTVVFNHFGVQRSPDRHQMEGWITIFIRICRQLVGRHVRPSRVGLIHQRRECSSELESYLGCSIEFGAEADQIALTEVTDDTVVVGADRYLNNLLISYCDEALAGRNVHEGAVRTRIENAIVPLLPHGKPRIGQIARRLGMSSRTLTRRLASEDLTYAEIVEDLRYSLAERYLSEAELSISRIAWLLGYREVSAFTHAFKRRSGQTPRQARSRLVTSAP
jgi:AraC-like DNA-binding protein